MIRAHLARRRVDADRRVLAALRHSTPAGGYDLWTRTGLRPGQVTLALARLEAAGLVVSEFETGQPPGRRRRLYRAAPANAPEPPPDDNDWLRSEDIRAARPRRAPRMPGGPP
jgi:DNA-binding transcriptional ArsR family regulator